MGFFYRIGRWVGTHKRLAAALVIGLPVVIVLTNYQSQPNPIAQQAARIEAIKIECVTNVAALMGMANQAMLDGKALQALAILAPCRQENASAEFTALIKAADDAVALQNTKAAAVAALVASEQAKADAAQAKIDKISSAAAEKAAKVQRKKEGVSIGMSAQQVLESSWGRPDNVNTTTTANGSREQWVYGRYRRGYLYFSDGTLTTIQN